MARTKKEVTTVPTEPKVPKRQPKPFKEEYKENLPLFTIVEHRNKAHEIRNQSGGDPHGRK